jgi:hypothetical protein
MVERRLRRVGTEEKAASFGEVTEEKRDNIEKRHADEMEDFEGLWREEILPRNRRPSNQLLHLQAVEKSLAVVGQFEDAEAVHRGGPVPQDGRGASLSAAARARPSRGTPTEAGEA